MKPQPKIVATLITGTHVKITCGVGEDGEVYLLDEKGMCISNGQDDYKTASPAVAAQVKATIKRADDFGKPKADFIRPDPASRPNEPEED